MSRYYVCIGDALLLEMLCYWRCFVIGDALLLAMLCYCRCFVIGRSCWRLNVVWNVLSMIDLLHLWLSL